MKYHNDEALEKHFLIMIIIFKNKTNIFITKSVIESKKLLIHGSIVGLVIEPRLNKWYHKYII